VTALARPRSEPRPAGDGVRVTLDVLLRLRAEAASLRIAHRRLLAARAGAYLSAQRGRGVDFEEARAYQPGDDIRNMDWRVTARSGQPHTKVYREERERPVLFLVDQGPSMAFGTRLRFKRVAAAEAAALLAWAAVDSGDRVGGVVVAGAAHTELRPRPRRQGALALCRALSTASAATPGADPRPMLDPALARLARIARPGSLVYVLSDFHALGQEAETHLVHLARHCEVIVAFIEDPIERRAPPPGRYPVTDGRRFLALDTSTAAGRVAYEARLGVRREALERLCRRHGLRYLRVATERPLVETLGRGLGAAPRRSS